MSEIDSEIVRDFFELNGFFVRQLGSNIAKANQKTIDQTLNFLVHNPVCKPNTQQPSFVLFSNEFYLIKEALICVKPWHNPRFMPNTLRGSAELHKFIEREIKKNAENWFQIPKESIDCNSPSLFRVLVLPKLPTHEPHKSETIKLLKNAQVNCVISFRAMLQGIIARIDDTHSMQHSALLCALQILKTYDMIKPSQLELL